MGLLLTTSVYIYNCTKCKKAIMSQSSKKCRCTETKDSVSVVSCDCGQSWLAYACIKLQKSEGHHCHRCQTGALTAN